MVLTGTDAQIVRPYRIQSRSVRPGFRHGAFVGDWLDSLVALVLLEALATLALRYIRSLISNF